MLSNVVSKKHGWHLTNQYANCKKMKKTVDAVTNTDTNLAKTGRRPALNEIS